MTSTARACFAGLAGFALALLLAGIIAGTMDVLSFQPGGEFETRWQAAFTPIVWGVVALATSGIGFAAALTAILLRARGVRWPGVFGFAGGVVVAGLLAFGVVSAMSPRWDVPMPLLAVATGMVVGMCVAGLAVVASIPGSRRAAA